MISQLRHAPEYAQNPNSEIRMVADFSKERARAFAAQYNCEYTDDYTEILDNNEIDAVSICTANESHAKIAIQALNAKKHVLCEKPMALTLDEAKEMIIAAHKNSKLLMPAHNQRLFKSHLRAKEIIDSNQFGRVLSFYTSFKHAGPEGWSVDSGANTWFMNKSNAGFGVLGDLGIHKIDTIHFLLGDKIKNVYANMDTIYKTNGNGEKISLEDEATVLCKMRSGITGTVCASWNNYGIEENFTIIYFEKGRMLVNYYHNIDIVIEKSNATSEEYKLGGKSSNDNQTHSGVIDGFIESIRTGSEPYVTAEDGYYSIAVLSACLKSSKLNTSVDIDVI